MDSGVAREYDGPSYDGHVIENLYHRYRWPRELNLGCPVSGMYSWLGSPMQTFIRALWRDVTYTDVTFRGRYSQNALQRLFANGHQWIKILITPMLLSAAVFEANEYWRKSVAVLFTTLVKGTDENRYKRRHTRRPFGRCFNPVPPSFIMALCHKTFPGFNNGQNLWSLVFHLIIYFWLKARTTRFIFCPLLLYVISQYPSIYVVLPIAP
jgi:hypothetical protein